MQNHPNTYRWQTNQRYYTATLCQDLLGDWVIIKTWGSRFTAHGQQRIELVADETQGAKKLKRLHRIRERRGYFRLQPHCNVRSRVAIVLTTI